MSKTENDQKTHLSLQSGAEVVVTRDDWRIEFNAHAKAPVISCNGQVFIFAEGEGQRAPAFLLRRLNATDIGQMIETDSVQQGILLAPAFQHLNRQGKRIGPVFDYFAAPQDTRFLDGSERLAAYYKDITAIASLKNVCGHSGILLRHDEDIYAAAESDPARLAQWHMPTLPLVNGRNIGINHVNINNMYAHKDTGAFGGTFSTEVASSGYPTHFYWSATLFRYDNALLIHQIHDFSQCRTNLTAEGPVYALSSRPVRAQLRPAE